VDRTAASGGDSGDSSTTDRWVPDLIKAAIVLALSWIGFLFVPNRLLAFLTTRVTPHARDALVTLWVIAFFIGLSWLFVTLQKVRRR
jgi:Kef-type K+ transport system membrane component KefB